MAIQLLLVEDHDIVRAGLSRLLAESGELEVVGAVQDGRAAIEFCGQYPVDVIVMDLELPELNGLDAAEGISRSHPEVGVVMLTAHYEERFVRRARELGIKGFVPKTSAFEQLTSAVKAVASGQSFYSASLDGSQSQSAEPDARPRLGLTLREREVLQHLTGGETTKGTARLLHISAKTVETHRRNLMRKLGRDNLADLTKYAIRHGITELNPQLSVSAV